MSPGILASSAAPAPAPAAAPYLGDYDPPLRTLLLSHGDGDLWEAFVKARVTSLEDVLLLENADLAEMGVPLGVRNCIRQEAKSAALPVDDAATLKPTVSAPSAQTMAREPPPKPRPFCSTEAEAKAWAAEWWAAYEAHAKDDNGGLYIDADELLAQLDATSAAGGLAPVRLLKLSWLEQRAAKIRAAPNEAARRALALPRRQELEAKHPEAFLSPAEMRALPKGYRGDPTLRLIAISHGWLTPEHPDPLGEQLVAFVKQVQSERSMLPGGAADSCCCCVEWACPLAAQVRRPAVG